MSNILDIERAEQAYKTPDIITVHNGVSVAWLKNRLKFEHDNTKVVFKVNPKCEFTSHCRIWIIRMQCLNSCLDKMNEYSRSLMNIKEK